MTLWHYNTGHCNTVILVSANRGRSISAYRGRSDEDTCKIHVIKRTPWGSQGSLLEGLRGLSWRVSGVSPGGSQGSLLEGLRGLSQRVIKSSLGGVRIVWPQHQARPGLCQVLCLKGFRSAIFFLCLLEFSDRKSSLCFNPRLSSLKILEPLALMTQVEPL